MADTHPADLTLLEAAAELARGTLSAHELTTACLQRIEAGDHAFGAWLRVYPQQALEAARAADRRRATGSSLGILDGVPIGEFACGTWGRNPWHPSFSPGGSSSGRFQAELAGLGAVLVPIDRPPNPLEDNGGIGGGFKTIIGTESASVHAQFAGREHLLREEFRRDFPCPLDPSGTAAHYVAAQQKRSALVPPSLDDPEPAGFTWPDLPDAGPQPAFAAPGSPFDILHLVA